MMAPSSATLDLVSSGHRLLEAPVYDPARGLLYTDAEAGGVWCLAGSGPARCIVPHRRGIGGLALHAAGGLVVSGRNVAFKPEPDGATLVLLENDPAAGHVGFNDLVTDAAGRIYVGSLSYVPMLGQSGSDKAGSLHLIDLDGTVQEVARGIGLSNGLGFSPDGRRLYHADSAARSVLAYDVAADGRLSGRTVFARVPAGMPDGLAVADDGSVWVALVHAGLVVAYEVDGRERERISVPTPMVTSVCFGDADGHTLYVVSGAEGATNGLGGCIYRRRLDVSGRPRHAARVQIPRARTAAPGEVGVPNPG